MKPGPGLDEALLNFQNNAIYSYSWNYNLKSHSLQFGPSWKCEAQGNSSQEIFRLVAALVWWPIQSSLVKLTIFWGKTSLGAGQRMRMSEVEELDGSRNLDLRPHLHQSGTRAETFVLLVLPRQQQGARRWGPLRAHQVTIGPSGSVIPWALARHQVNSSPVSWPPKPLAHLTFIWHPVAKRESYTHETSLA